MQTRKVALTTLVAWEVRIYSEGSFNRAISHDLGCDLLYITVHMITPGSIPLVTWVGNIVSC